MLFDAVGITEKVSGAEEIGGGPVGVITWGWWNGPDRANLVISHASCAAC